MDPVTLMNLLSAVLMLFLAVLQFTPYWQFNGQSSSINGYVWFPLDHTDLVNYLTENVGAFDTNGVVWMPILTLLLALAGIICCIKWDDLPICTAIAVVFGLVGLIGYSSIDIYGISSLCGLHLVLCVLALIAGAIGTILFIVNKVKS